MDIYFADSSALLKRYRNEVGSPHVLDLLENAEETYISRLAAVEVSAALTRRAKGAKLRAEELLAALALLDADLAESFEITELDHPIMAHAMAIARQHGLKGADSMQLSSALFVQRVVVKSEIILLSSDLELNAAAEAEGLRVENPIEQP